MLNLTDPLAYLWFDIFAVLSWERFDQFLDEIEFPLSADISLLRPTAREFVTGFATMPTYAYEAGHLIDKAQQLFDQTNAALISKLGDVKANTLYRWGNQLNLDRRLESALWFASEILFQILVRDWQAWETKVLSLSTPTVALLQSLIRNDRAARKELGNLIDAIDNAAHEDHWGKALYSFAGTIWKDERKNETPVYTSDILWGWVRYYRMRSLIRTLRDSLNQEELVALNEIFRSHPNWIKAQSRPSPPYYQPRDLLELIKEV